MANTALVGLHYRTLSTPLPATSWGRLVDVRVCKRSTAIARMLKWPFIPNYSRIYSQLWFSTWLRWYALRHLGCLKFEILTAMRFRRSIRIGLIVPNFVTSDEAVAKIWRFLDFSKWLTVRHLGFVMHVFSPPRTVLSDLYRCAKFGWNRH